MATDRDLEQFLRVYTERSDDELAGLYENRDDLTDLAQQALAQVMKDRGISVTGVPVDEPVQSRESAHRVLSEDEAELQTFDDAFRLNEALRLLTEAEIPHRVLNRDEVDPTASASRGRAMSLGLIVGKAEQSRAQKLLNDRMKLFPKAEGGDVPAEDGFTLLVIFAREEAMRVAQALGAEGISYIWTDGRQDMTMDESEVRLEVYASSVDEAMGVVKRVLG